jgi:hypothetical protein
MEKSTKIKYWVDVLMFVFLLLTGTMGFLALLTDSSSLVKWHVFFAVTTVFFVVIHLLLHKEWIAFNSKKLFQKQNKPKE